MIGFGLLIMLLVYIPEPSIPKALTFLLFYICKQKQDSIIHTQGKESSFILKVLRLILKKSRL